MIRLDYKIGISVYQIEFNSQIVTLTQDGDMRWKLVGWCRQGSHFSGLTKFPDFSSIFCHFSSIFFMFCFF